MFTGQIIRGFHLWPVFTKSAPPVFILSNVTPSMLLKSIPYTQKPSSTWGSVTKTGVAIELFPQLELESIQHNVSLFPT